ncbi:hypothetical protein [Bradyrhizobium icense]|nr:hypothetical protein [Bradyrhizobium icense]
MLSDFLNTFASAYSTPIFALAVDALPLLVRFTAGVMVFHGARGTIGRLLVGIAAAALMLLIGQITFALALSFVLRAVIAAVFAIPAAVAGYHVILGYRTLGCHPRSGARSFAASVRSSSVTRGRAA